MIKKMTNMSASNGDRSSIRLVMGSMSDWMVLKIQASTPNRMPVGNTTNRPPMTVDLTKFFNRCIVRSP